ncbi:hypothetical protein LPJ59_003308 [Coemansia sp. RSA 2399]|nr:hypothetical protein LPJ59_003308 [Coemansia sp. RSA 2399]
MGASDGERKKKAVLGSMASDSQAASSPELASQIFLSCCSLMTGLAAGQPAATEASTRSSIGTAGGDAADCLTTGSQPSIAATFSSDSHHVEARGRIYSQSNATHSSTKPTLAMMKPLAALNNQSDTLTGKDKCTEPVSSKTPNNRARRSTVPAAAVAHISAESSPSLDSEEKPSTVAINKKADKRPSSMYMWAALSRFSSSGSASDSDVTDPANDRRMPAIDHLKTIETRQVRETEEDTRGDDIQSSLNEGNSDGAKPEEKEKLDDNSWAWRWFGGQSSRKSPSKSSDVAPPPALVAVSAEQEVGADAVIPGQIIDPKEHNAHQKDNVLLPDLFFGETISDPKASHTHESDTCVDASNNSVRSSESSETATSLKKDVVAKPSDRDAEQPMYKKLRTMGMTALGSAIEMAPGWARSMLYGQSSADALGQQGNDDGFGDRTGQTAESINESIDKGARSLGRVAIIGIHGWFPMRMVQMLAGEPTGKSEKFCLMMREALQTYLLDNHGVNIDDSKVSLFPLVGEGKIDDRVELLLSQIIDATEPDTGGLAAMPKEDDPATRSNSRAASMKETTTSIDSNKPTASAAADNNNSPPSSRHSEIMARILMPERSRRVEVLKEADTVFVVTHSQGTPVSAIILERLIEMEIIDTTRQRIAMLAMAGISHGPLPYLKDNVVIKYIESEATRELFELMDPSSPQSQRYVAALSTILHKGVRLVCIGSWVDEVVPLYSAILQGVSHQNVYRAVYIDARHYLDDFLTNLIAFALRLRNMGIYDHDLLIHLSGVVAGTLWNHSGHSTVYAEPSVYKLAIRWLLYSTSPAATSAHVSTSVPTAFLGPSAGGGRLRGKRASVSGPQIHMSYRPFNATEKLNPFFIPWIMRTLWDEPEIRQNEDLRTELRRLVKLFDQWAPDTKVGKELKYRLEPVRAAM